MCVNTTQKNPSVKCLPPVPPILQLSIQISVAKFTADRVRQGMDPAAGGT